jgi:hypothetical protein
MKYDELTNKWTHKIEDGWYGFAISGISDEWTDKIDAFLEYLNVHCPEFKIHQIKVKFGGLRIYVKYDMLRLPDDISSEIYGRIISLEGLYDEKLVY